MMQIRAVNATANGDPATAVGTLAMGVCNRTPQVRTMIESALGKFPGECNTVRAHDLLRITSIDLRNKGTTSLKADDFAGFRATTADLRDPSLTTLPGALFEGQPLVRIKLGGIALRSLPADLFDGLTTLRILTVDSLASSVKTVDKDLLEGLTKLENLTLNNTKLESLPEELLKDLTKLTQITFNKNSALTWLPDLIFQPLQFSPRATIDVRLFGTPLNCKPNLYNGKMNLLFDTHRSLNFCGPGAPGNPTLTAGPSAPGHELDRCALAPHQAHHRLRRSSTGRGPPAATDRLAPHRHGPDRRPSPA